MAEDKEKVVKGSETEKEIKAEDNNKKAEDMANKAEAIFNQQMKK